MKVSPVMAREFKAALAASGLNRTTLLKSLVVVINRDTVAPDTPEPLPDLQILAAVAAC